MAQPPRTLANLRPNPKNPRTITAAKRKQLAAALDKFGDLGGIVFNARSGQLVGGHQRVSAFNAQTPVVVTKAYDAPTRTGTVAEGYVVLSGERFSFREVQWDDATEKAANLAANKGAGEFDLGLVGEWVNNLKDANFDLDLTMFDADERSGLPPIGADAILSQSNSDDLLPDLPADPIVKLGDIISLGRHKLMCGDSVNVQHINDLVRNCQVTMVYTDPPYGMRLEADYSTMKKGKNFKAGVKGGTKHRNVQGDHDDFDSNLISVVLDYFSSCDEVFLWGADYYAEIIPNRKNGSFLIWDKRLDESTDKMFGSGFEMCWSKNRHKRDLVRIKWAGIWGMSQEFDNKRHHPTQKPIALATYFLERWGKPKDIVADLYGGSGSTLLACEKTDRTCLMMEIDPAYCDVIISRWEAMTGQKAQLVGNRTAKDALHA